MPYMVGVLWLACILVNGTAVAQQDRFSPVPGSLAPSPQLTQAVDPLEVPSADEVHGAYGQPQPNLRHLPPDTSAEAAEARERAIGAAVRALLQSKTW